MANTARRRALSAVSRITFTLGLVGCIQPADSVDPEPDAADAELVDAELDAGAEDAEHVADADAVTDAEAVTDADVVADAATDCQQSENWADCCEAAEWQADAGCLAWGPPVPPSMPGEVA